MSSLSGLRILAFAGEFPPYPGGIGTYAVNMAQAATELGAIVTVVAPDYERPTPSDEAYSFEVVRFRGREHRNRELWSKYLLSRAAIRRGSYDLVHAMDWPFFIPVALAARDGQRRLFTIHGSDANDMARRKKRAAVRIAGVFSNRSEIVANSAYTLNLLRKRFPDIRPRSLRYEHLGVADFWRVAEERSEAARLKLDLPPERFVLITVGRLVPRKGQLRVIQALNSLPEKIRKHLVYLVIGSGVDPAYTAEVDKAIASADFEIRRMTGISNDVLRAIYANSDAFCLAAEETGDGTVEGFGLVFLEAGAQGLPLIAGGVGAVQEVVLDGVSGLVVTAADTVALAEAIGRLVNDKGLCEALAVGARARASELSWQRCAANTYRQH